MNANGEWPLDAACGAAQPGALHLACMGWCKSWHANDHCIKCNCQACDFCADVMAHWSPSPSPLPPPPDTPPPLSPDPMPPPPPKPP
eukprot:2583337-Prymnesium_polylepis.1